MAWIRTTRTWDDKCFSHSITRSYVVAFAANCRVCRVVLHTSIATRAGVSANVQRDGTRTHVPSCLVLSIRNWCSGKSFYVCLHELRLVLFPRLTSALPVMATKNSTAAEPSSAPIKQVSIAVVGNQRANRRLSIGGFPVIEEDDFTKAMGRLTGDEAVEEDDSMRAHDIVAEAEAELFTSYTEATNRPPMTQEEIPYWRLGKLMDVSVYARDPAQSKPKSIATIEHAIADPNPPPRPGTLAVPPPIEIMSPEGNAVANNRLEKCLLHNDVTTAQKIVSHPTALYELAQEGLFRRACSNTGYEAGSLLPPGKAAFKRDPITGRPRTRQEQEVAAHMWEIARLKHLALIVTEYKQLMADEAAAVRQLRVKERRASMAMFEAQHEAMRHASREGAKTSRGSTIPRPATSSTSVLEASPTRYLSLHEMGLGAGGSREEGNTGGPQHEEAHQKEEADDDGMEAGAEELQRGSVASMPESITQGQPEGKAEWSTAVTGRSHRKAHGVRASSSGLQEQYSEDVLREAEAVGLEPAVVHAALHAKEVALRELEQVEAKVDQVVAAARASISASRSRTSSRGAGSVSKSPTAAKVS